MSVQWIYKGQYKPGCHLMVAMIGDVRIGEITSVPSRDAHYWAIEPHVKAALPSLVVIGPREHTFESTRQVIEFMASCWEARHAHESKH